MKLLLDEFLDSVLTRKGRIWGKKQKQSCLARLGKMTGDQHLLWTKAILCYSCKLENKVDRQMDFLLQFSPEDFY